MKHEAWVLFYFVSWCLAPFFSAEFAELNFYHGCQRTCACAVLFVRWVYLVGTRTPNAFACLVSFLSFFFSFSVTRWLPGPGRMVVGVTERCREAWRSVGGDSKQAERSPSGGAVERAHRDQGTRGAGTGGSVVGGRSARSLRCRVWDCHERGWGRLGPEWARSREPEGGREGGTSAAAV